jgi:hypothetical protein
VVAGPLAAVPLRATAEDGAVFGLVEEWWQQWKSGLAALTRSQEIIQPLMPPGLQTTEDSILLAKGRAILTEVMQRPEIVALDTEFDQRRETCSAVAAQLAETPANTLAGINAKLQLSMKSGRNTDIAQSAADDLDRLVGSLGDKEPPTG